MEDDLLPEIIPLALCVLSRYLPRLNCSTPKTLELDTYLIFRILDIPSTEGRTASYPTIYLYLYVPRVEIK